jgi:hypothetical protein
LLERSRKQVEHDHLFASCQHLPRALRYLLPRA